eukprot:jgi/Mesen1/6972/ME000361S06123
MSSGTCYTDVLEAAPSSSGVFAASGEDEWLSVFLTDPCPIKPLDAFELLPSFDAVAPSPAVVDIPDEILDFADASPLQASTLSHSGAFGGSDATAPSTPDEASWEGSLLDPDFLLQEPTDCDAFDPKASCGSASDSGSPATSVVAGFHSGAVGTPAFKFSLEPAGPGPQATNGLIVGDASTAKPPKDATATPTPQGGYLGGESGRQASQEPCQGTDGPPLVVPKANARQAASGAGASGADEQSPNREGEGEDSPNDDSGDCQTATETAKREARLMRNRESAQLSRQRKKVYMDELEGRLQTMAATVAELQNTIAHLTAENVNMRRQLACYYAPPPGTGGRPGVVPMMPGGMPPYLGMGGYPPPGFPGYLPTCAPPVPIPRLKKPKVEAAAKKESKKTKARSGSSETVPPGDSSGAAAEVKAKAGGAEAGQPEGGGGEEGEGGRSRKRMKKAAAAAATAGASAVALALFCFAFVTGPAAVPAGSAWLSAGPLRGGIWAGAGGGALGWTGSGAAGTSAHAHAGGRVLMGLEESDSWTNRGGGQFASRGGSSRFGEGAASLGEARVRPLRPRQVSVPASLSVPRDNKLVKIDGNLIIRAVMAGDNARWQEQNSAQALAQAQAQGRERAAGLLKGDGQGVAEERGRGRGGGEAREGGAAGAAPHALGGLTGLVLREGVCTELFQFDASHPLPPPLSHHHQEQQRHSSPEEEPSLVSSRSLTSAAASDNVTATSSVGERRRLLHRPDPYAVPLPPAVSAAQAANQTRTPGGGLRRAQHNLRGGSAATAASAAAQRERPPGGNNPGRGGASSSSSSSASARGGGGLSQIFVVVLVNGVKYVTYSCMLPTIGGTSVPIVAA